MTIYGRLIKLIRGWVSHFKKYKWLYISSITEFEVVNGATKSHLDFWNGMLKRFTVIDFDSRAARKAAEIVAQLKTKRKAIDKPDLFIALLISQIGRPCQHGCFNYRL